VPYFSVAFARSDAGWIGTETDLAEVAGVDDITDIMRETAVETAGDTVVLLIEQEDEWFAVVRLDDGATLTVPNVGQHRYEAGQRVRVVVGSHGAFVL